MPAVSTRRFRKDQLGGAGGLSVPVAVIGATLCLTGCSLNVVPKVVIVPLDARLLADRASPIRLASTEAEPGATQSYTANDLPLDVGPLDKADLDALAQSLRSSLEPAATMPDGTSGRPLDLHVLVRFHITYMAVRQWRVLSAVAWCLADSSGEIVFHEQFFATARGGPMTWVGGTKEKLYEHLIGRIASKALGVAKATPPSAEQAFEKTFPDFKAAADDIEVPTEVAVGSGKVMTVNVTYSDGRKETKTVPLPPETRSLDPLEGKQPVDWKAYVTARRPAR